MNPHHRNTIGIAIACLLTATAINSTHAGLFGSKTTREYKKLRDQARKADDPNERIKQLRAAHEVIKKETDSRYYDESLLALGRFYRAHDRFYLAEPHYREAMERAVEKHGTNHLSTARAMFGHAQSLMGLHRFNQAEEELMRVEHTARWKTGRYSITVGYCRAVVGQLKVLQGRHAEAVEWLESSLKQMGRSRSFTSVSGMTQAMVGAGTSMPGVSTDVYRPDPYDVVHVLIDYAIALLGADREADAEEALNSARQVLVEKLRYAMPDYYIKRRFSEAAEAAGDIKQAERYIYEAVTAAYQATGATPRQKQGANFRALGFHIRQGDYTKAGTQEGILMQKGVTLDELDPYNNHQLRLRQERAIGKSPKQTPEPNSQPELQTSGDSPPGN